MKNISLLAIAFMISHATSAQNYSDTSHPKMHHDYAMHQGYEMKNGSLVWEKNGKITPVTQDVTLKNGTRIMTNGEVDWKNGKSEMLKEGEMIDMNGQIHREMNMHHHDMKMNDQMSNKSDSSMMEHKMDNRMDEDSLK